VLACNGLEAVEKSTEEDFDLILMDVSTSTKCLIDIAPAPFLHGSFTIYSTHAIDLPLDSFLFVVAQVQMPVLDGFQATTKIREMEKERDPSRGERIRFMPVVAMTAHAMSGDAERIMSAGMDAYISKPLNAKKLQELLHSVASGQLQKSSSFRVIVDDDVR